MPEQHLDALPSVLAAKHQPNAEVFLATHTKHQANYLRMSCMPWSAETARGGGGGMCAPVESSAHDKRDH